MTAIYIILGGVLGSFVFSRRRRHTRCSRDWSSDVCSSDLPLDAEVVQLSAAPVGEIGTLETAARIRDRHMLDGVASIGASERVEARIGGEVTAILKHWDRHDELILVVQSPGPEHERPPIEIVGQGRGDLTALICLELG